MHRAAVLGSPTMAMQLPSTTLPRRELTLDGVEVEQGLAEGAHRGRRRHW